jgi:RNA polymerase-binding transcription factor DksA
MADEADIANELITREVTTVLDRLRQETVPGMGPEMCTECGEAIPPVRRKHGFRLCVPCAEVSERRSALFADGT